MPYYSYGYGYDSANLIYLILLVQVLLLSLYAQAAVSGNFSRYSKVTNRRGLTGAQAAASVLRAHGITDVGIARCSGKLTDHYDPRNNTIFLSDSVYDAATVAAVGVAAHEAGHAVQYAVGYGPVKLRSAIVKTTQFSSQASFIILMIGLVLYSQPILLLGIVLFGVVAFFQLVTLPVEFNASHRALETLEGEHILEDEEMAGARKVLRAAALTYVAALLSSLLQLLRYALIFLNRNGAWIDGALKQVLKRDGLSGRDAAFASRIAYGVMQNRIYLDRCLARCLTQRPEKLEPLLLDILRAGAYQILLMDKVPVNAAVNEAVEMAKAHKLSRAAGLVNAVLRNVDRRRGEPLAFADELEALSVQTSHPRALVERVVGLLGAEEAEAFLRWKQEHV